MSKLQIEVNEDRFQELQVLMQKCDITTYKDLFNNAMSLFEWAVRQREIGRMVASVDESNKSLRELSMPALERIHSQARRRSVA